MGRIARSLLTNFSKGELSPTIEGRPDLASYFEGGSLLLNWLMLRQGGITRRPGLRFIAEVKDHSKDTILFPFEASVADTYVMEASESGGMGYLRVYKDKQQVKVGIAPVEIAAPWLEAQIRAMAYTQSVDIAYYFNRDIRQHKLVRVSGDTIWSFQPIVYSPPPSFEDDTDISGGTATLTPGALTGTNVIFAASAALFLEGDVGRQIIFGAASATITGFGISAGDTTSPNTSVRVTIVDAFPNLDPIPAGQWLLRGSPNATIDPTKKGPLNTGVAIATNPAKNTFRAADVGKFITIYGGLIKIKTFVDAQNVSGTILSELIDAEDDNPAATPNWTLEVESWNVINGFPGIGDFFEGRLFQASSHRQKTTFWGSESDNYDSHAKGNTPSKAIDYTYASRGLNQFEWLADNEDLFFGSSGSEVRARGGRDDIPMGGDEIPLVKAFGTLGSAPIMPIVVAGRIIFVERSRKQIHMVQFDIEKDGHGTVELTAPADHVTGSGIRLGPVAFQKRLHPRIYWVSDDGHIVVLTYYPNEKVIGFTRLATDGVFEAVASVAHDSHNDHVYAIVRRTISGQERRYVEVFDDHAGEMEGREWEELQTDSAKVYALNDVATHMFADLDHLEGKTVDVVVDGSYRGTRVVVDGMVSIPADEAGLKHAEIGLHYDSPGATMRPAIEGSMVEGMFRAWKKLWVRLHKSMGGSVNGKELNYPPGPLGELHLFSGDRVVTASGGGYDERITFAQNLPYPMTILALFGDIEFGES